MENIRPIEHFKFTEEEYADYLNGVEIWRKIKNYEDYQVSTFGRIKSFKHKKAGKLKRPNRTKSGYLQMQLYSGDGNYITMKIHRIMGEMFLHNPNDLPDINHDNLIKDFNMLYNIEWISKSGNCQHAIRNGRVPRYWKGRLGADCPFSKAVNQYDMNGNLINEFGGVREASRITGINRSGIGSCTRGEKGSHEGFKWRFA